MARINRYNRSNFYTSTMVDGVLEKDLLTNKFKDYSFKNQFINYTLQYEDYMRPDLISMRAYGTNEYWWIVLECNPDLEDIWNDYGYSNETVMVLASNISPQINNSNDYLVEIDKKEYMYPNAYKVGEVINLPTLSDIQDFYTFSNSK